MKLVKLTLTAVMGLPFFLFGMAAESSGQVPLHQERIRDTAKDILARPEFRAFSRLKPGQPARGVSEMQTGRGVPRLKSSRGLPREVGENADQTKGLRQPAKGNSRSHAPNGLPENAPDGNRPQGHRPGNLEDALGREDVFPEAGKIDGLLDDNNLNPNPQGNLPRNEGNEPGPEANNLRGNGPENPPNQAPNPAVPPPEPGPANDREQDPNADKRDQKGDPNALPAPRPREHSESSDENAFAFPEPPVSELARFVGAMFHYLAWGILAVICGLILWLIIKAILEYERPRAYANAHSAGKDLLDLEPAQAPGDFPADIYLGQARKLAEQGRYREAVSQLLLGAMSRVERAGWVRFRRGMTVRDYLRMIHQFPAAHQGFRSIIRVFEPLAFGRREPTLAHFEQSLKGYETGFGMD